ncbi:MAG: restriction endonuclease subunit S [Fimbriimonadaceae bacterium]|nr:restriction endonuclease subunit S [Fimbriimonadaceae bacterium]QOJ10857.1 MAG: restriction endonuclease subunit S [Chthonomonadaceae bacterium]
MIEVKKRFTLLKSELSRKFRVENNNLDFSQLIEATGYQVARIGDLAKAHRNERNKKKTADSRFKYVQISDIDVELGRIKSFRVFKGADAPNNARRIMKEGDILVSTRRPTRGAVVAVPQDFDEHICTVFFTTLRVTDREILDPFYLALFLRTSLGRMQFQAQITETAYPVISDSDVEDLTVLYPSIDDQRKIAAEYDIAVKRFQDAINSAYREIAAAQQSIEDFVLGEDAEQIAVKQFTLGQQIEEEKEELNGE